MKAVLWFADTHTSWTTLHKGVYGSRCFARIGPKLWNLLPPRVREESDTDEFKKKLKTYLFDNYERLAVKLKER